MRPNNNNRAPLRSKGKENVEKKLDKYLKYYSQLEKKCNCDPSKDELLLRAFNHQFDHAFNVGGIND